MNAVWLFWITYLGLGAIASVLELVRPTRKLAYFRLDTLPLDLISCVLFQSVLFATASWLTSMVPLHFTATRMIASVPLPLRVGAYYVLGDLGTYWMHRLMHTKGLWCFHRFHHSVTQMWWLSGVRATIPQQVLYNMPYLFITPMLVGAPSEVYAGLMVAGVLTNHWMHMNFSWRSNWLEKVFVTPRTHSIHHSADYDQHDGNYGTVFTLWDRLFGTYIDPDTTVVTAFGSRTPLRWYDAVRYQIGI
nr:sterol desaturase family protein [Kofleriaceae bacterium]